MRLRTVEKARESVGTETLGSGSFHGGSHYNCNAYGRGPVLYAVHPTGGGETGSEPGSVHTSEV